MDEEQRSQAAIKRKRHSKIVDKDASYGPPDKSEHFIGSDEDLPNPKRNQIGQQCNKDRKEVEVLYSDGVWYRGWLDEYNFETGKWIVNFYEDSETTEVNFPDDEVQLL